MKKWVLWVFVCSLLSAASAPAAVYDLNRTLAADGGTRYLRLNIPDTLAVVRGILIYGNGASGDSTAMATDAELVAFAESYGFAVLGTGYWYNFSYEGDVELLLFEAMLQDFANQSGHAELVNAPWLPMGFSNGGQMSYGFNAVRPEKVIGFITTKGAYYNNPVPPTAALLTPGILTAGEVDTDVRRTNIKALFDNNRPRGALWAWIEEQGMAHQEGNSRQLLLPFLAECVRLRYPADQSPVDGPVTLKNLHEFDGWLVDQNSWRADPPRIYAYDDAPGDKRSYGWVLNEKIARYYQAFASYAKATESVSSSGGVVAAPATVFYSFPKPSARSPVPAVDFYLNGGKAATLTPPYANPLAVSAAVSTGGFYVGSAMITYSDGSQRVTPLRRVFVKGPPAPSAFESWAAAHLPEGQRDPNGLLFDDNITNLERFAFGLSVTQPTYDFQPLQPADPATETLDGKEYVVYAYDVNAAAVTAGLNIMPQVSHDQQSWTDVVSLTDPLAAPLQFVTRQANRIMLKYPVGPEPLFFRMHLSDTFEGLKQGI